MKTVTHILEAKGPEVHTIGPDDSVLDALKRMAEKGVGALVVTDAEGRIVGLLSERDYARKVVLLGRVSKDTPTRDIMTAEVVCVSPEQSVDTCMGLMTQKHIRHLPVVAEERLVGLISIGDVVKAVIDDHKFAIEQLEHYIMGHR
ncbi:MAG: CBS domain-containing protein [Acidobacteriota bacterium]|jgi:CBS domain-containing protein|nr:CBS domain-containing protein [Acidobacteriota bacterium]